MSSQSIMYANGFVNNFGLVPVRLVELKRRGSGLRLGQILASKLTRPTSTGSPAYAYSQTVKPPSFKALHGVLRTKRLLIRRRRVISAAGETEATMINTVGERKRTSAFIVGLLWFFAHQLIGVANDVIMKHTGSTLAVVQVVFLRFAFATVTMLPVMFASGSDSFKTERLHLHIARSILLAAAIALYCKGLSTAPIAVVTTLNFTIPMFTLLLARFFLDEKVDKTRWLGTLTGFVGVTVVVQPGGASFNPMWLVVLLSAALFAALDVLNKIFVGKESFWAMIFYTAFFTTLISAYPAYLSWVPPSTAQLVLMAFLGGGANLLLYCLLKSFSLVDASALAPFRYVELLWSAVIGALLFAEVPATSTLVGAAVIIPSTLYIVWAENKKSKGD